MELGNLTETLSGLETTVIKLNATVHELQLRFDKNRNDLDDISTLIQDAVKNATDIMVRICMYI